MTAAAGDIADAGTTVERSEQALVGRHLPPELLQPFLTLFDDSHYRVRSGLAEASRYEALEHYLQVGWREGLDPHPLFDTRHYLETNPQVAHSGVVPLVHYLSEGAQAGADPSPYFDTAYYYSQADGVTPESVNALVHYVTYGPLGQSCNPNPLFGNGYYLSTHPDVRSRGESPLAHFLRQGREEGAPASPAHADLLQALRSQPRLLRGHWRNGSVLFLLHGSAGADAALAAQEVLAHEHKLEGRVVLLRRPPELGGADLPPGTVVLEEHGPNLLWPSALRLLALSLASQAALYAVGDVVELLPAAETAGIPAYFLALDSETANGDLARAVGDATRVIYGSHGLLRETAGATGPSPTNAVVRSFERETIARFLSSTLELAARDGAPVTTTRPSRQAKAVPTRRILVPCTDWAVSGVNTALEAVGQELVRRGWELEVVFTRDRALVEQSLGPTPRLPELPHRWLAPRRPGIEGMWEALIAETEAEAPCIVFTGYDFYGNSVVPALTSAVGAVMWAQADDGDYYEQAYRLGRYCNAVVCVSDRIREQVAGHHPLIGERAHVIHNTSVRDADVVPRKPRRAEKLRIVYTGRLVQYQKRILDFVLLADALEALGLDFTIDLAGTAPAHDEAATLLPQRAARHLDAGRMRLLGRLSRAEVLDELRDSDLFVLLSDFEGLPLSLVEAMASGCVPVVAEMGSGIAELLVPGENGLVVQGRDYASWARTIRDLWRDEPRLTAMAERAQQTVRDSFTVEAIAEQFDALFGAVAEEIVNGYERPPALTWGPRRARFGDVLPPPTMYRAFPVAGLG